MKRPVMLNCLAFHDVSSSDIMCIERAASVGSETPGLIAKFLRIAMVAHHLSIPNMAQA